MDVRCQFCWWNMSIYHLGNLNKQKHGSKMRSKCSFDFVQRGAFWGRTDLRSVVQRCACWSPARSWVRRGRTWKREELSEDVAGTHSKCRGCTLTSGGPTSPRAARFRTREMHERIENAFKIQALGVGRYFFIVKSVYSVWVGKKKAHTGYRLVLSDSLQPPCTVAHQAPLSMGFPWQEYWSGLPLPSQVDHPDPGIEPVSPALAGRFFTTEPPGKPHICYRNTEKHLKK